MVSSIQNTSNVNSNSLPNPTDQQIQDAVDNLDKAIGTSGEKGAAEGLYALIGGKENLNTYFTPKDLYSVFGEAVADGDDKAANFLLQNGYKTSTPAEAGYNPTTKQYYEVKSSLVAVIQQAGVNPNFESIAKSMISDGADITSALNDNSPVFAALDLVKKGDDSIMDALLAKDPELINLPVTMPNGQKGNTLLLNAVNSSNLAAVEYLAKQKDINLNYIGPSGMDAKDVARSNAGAGFPGAEDIYQFLKQLS